MRGQPFEKTGNTWWVKCTCTTWFPASEQIVRHKTVMMRCPHCKRSFLANEAADLLDPSSQHVKFEN